MATFTSKKITEHFWEFFPKKGLVLDVGCDDRWFTDMHKERCVGLDINGKPDMRADMRALPLKSDVFSGIFCCHVIEHVENPLDVMKEFKRILKDGGKILLFVPHYKHSGAYAEYDHKIFFSKESLRRLATRSDLKKFKIYERRGYRFFSTNFEFLPCDFIDFLTKLIAKFLNPSEIVLEAKISE